MTMTTIQYRNGKITSVTRHEGTFDAPRVEGRQWFCYNDARWALANLIAHTDSRPRNPANTAAIVQHLIEAIGGNAFVDSVSFSNPIIPL